MFCHVNLSNFHDHLSASLRLIYLIEFLTQQAAAHLRELDEAPRVKLVSSLYRNQHENT